ncbi:MAG: DUF2189 domain-containing protein [Sphingomonadaceae bacterium]|uniref:DUF2189 domain-containing protein n=1 Tax=Thermaurantiacus sp. TaxID=2820283 RepID=UPI00298EE0D9|nr:DUF2189 domain-containing protein [Thermaurantiacus sp.]MCS6986350.1 DUF2189 domain-containing protein [Sphingomonadaceae bacterium]MDW8414388.1 DUF2189 domain-containing protein [Thermaurantiacus sp.]
MASPVLGPAFAGPVDAPVRRLDVSDLRWALAAGWDDFRTLRGEILFVPLVYAAIGFLSAAIAFRRDLFPLIFPMAAGFALVGPVAAAGFYEIARRREEGREAGWRHFLDPLRGPARLPLLFLATALAGLFLLWVAAAQAIYDRTLGKLGPPGPAEFLSALFTTAEGWRMIVVGHLVGAAFAFVALVTSAFSLPMVVDRAADPATAVLTSVRAFRASPLVMLRWGVIVAALLVMGSLPLFMGLTIALPVLGYATWHLYTRAVVRDA